MQFLDESGSTDEELVLLAKASDDRAFEALLLRYDNLLSNISGKFFIQGHDSNDLLQIARIGIWEAVQCELSDTECAIVIEMINRRNSKTVDKDLRGRVSIYRDISAKLHIPEKGVDNAWQRIKRKYKAWYAEKFCYTG